ncbi:MAG: hypothetical protein JNJ60_18345, partial [Rhodocyclaceae bacterium]|nr:hypothetical protein [Rhodocyclaceae bacterium]
MLAYSRRTLSASVAGFLLLAGCAGPRLGTGALVDATEVDIQGPRPMHVAYTAGVALPAAALGSVSVQGVEESPRLTALVRDIFASYGITATTQDTDPAARLTVVLAIGTLTDSANPCGVPLDRYLSGPEAAAQRYCVPLPGTGSGGTPVGGAGNFGSTNLVGA